jgi:hypothetical protein
MPFSNTHVPLRLTYLAIAQEQLLPTDVVADCRIIETLSPKRSGATVLLGENCSCKRERTSPRAGMGASLERRVFGWYFGGAPAVALGQSSRTALRPSVQDNVFCTACKCATLTRAPTKFSCYFDKT